jgi:putative hydrolase of HD superfamily
LRGKTLGFLSALRRVKVIPRSGWVSHGVALQDVESVADHSYSTCALAMLLADIEVEKGQRINVERVLRLALLHDLAEALTFDISKSYLEYLGRKGEAIKREFEHAAWDHIIKSIQNASIRKSYARLVSEYDAEETLESKIVHAADSLDILFQVVEYHRRGYPKAMLSDLWAGTNRRLMHVRLSSVRQLRKIAVRLYKAAISGSLDNVNEAGW